MISPRPHRLHLENSQSLVTSYEATRAGFVALALERSRRATPLHRAGQGFASGRAHGEYSG